MLDDDEPLALPARTVIDHDGDEPLVAPTRTATDCDEDEPLAPSRAVVDYDEDEPLAPSRTVVDYDEDDEPLVAPARNVCSNDEAEDDEPVSRPARATPDEYKDDKDSDEPVMRQRAVHWAPELTARMDDDDDDDDDDDLERAIDEAVARADAKGAAPKPVRTRAKANAKPRPRASGKRAQKADADTSEPATAFDKACAAVSSQRRKRAPRKPSTATAAATKRKRASSAKAKATTTEDDIEQAMLETAEMALEKEEHRPMPNAPLPESTRKRTRQDADALADFYESIATGGERPKGTVNVLALAGGTKSGQILPHTTMFGPPLTVPATPATVPLGNSDVVHFMAEALLMANSRRTTGSSAAAASAMTPRIEYRPRHLSAHDMQNHYLVESVPRPSPVDPEVTLFPRPCALGENCTAFQIALPMTLAVVPHAKPSFALVGALPEREMRQFYQTGIWPGEPVECVLCMHFFPVLAASMLGKSTARSPALCFQAMCSDTHPVHGFKPEALLLPSVTSAVLELPMFNAITANLRRSVHVGINFVDISHTMNRPVVFSNTARWTSDMQGEDF